MQRVVLLFFVISAVTTAPATDYNAQAIITEYTNENDGTGNYEFSYRTSNGITRYEKGKLVNAGQSNEHIAVKGSYNYIDAYGDERLFLYSADENGYKVIETSPPSTPQPREDCRDIGASLLASCLG